MKKKQIIVLGIVLVIMVIVIVVAFFLRPKDVAIKKVSVKHDTVDALYENIKADECTDISSVENATSYLVFSQMKNDKILSDNISLADYNSTVDKVLSASDGLNIDGYSYDGYKYTLTDSGIVREKSECSEYKYVSKLYGYSYNNNSLEVDVSFGYVKDDKVYNLSNEEIGAYSDDEISKVLDKGTIRVYVYEKSDGNYYLKEVTNK